MILFVPHNVLVDEAGLLLLQALRSYLELTSIGFEAHTTDTIADGGCELLTLDLTMTVSSLRLPQSGRLNFSFSLAIYRRLRRNQLRRQKLELSKISFSPPCL